MHGSAEQFQQQIAAGDEPATQPKVAGSTFASVLQ
jgi:hypothetical protein